MHLQKQAGSLQPVIHSFQYCCNYIGQQVSGLSHDQLCQQPAGFRNHPLWVIGHIAFSCEAMAGELNVNPWLPDDWKNRFGGGSQPVSEPDVYESAEVLLSILSDSADRFLAALRECADSVLDSPVPDKDFRDRFPSLRFVLTQIMVGHTANHVGQISAWRQLMQLPPLRQPFI